MTREEVDRKEWRRHKKDIVISGERKGHQYPKYLNNVFASKKHNNDDEKATHNQLFVERGNETWKHAHTYTCCVLENLCACVSLYAGNTRYTNVHWHKWSFENTWVRIVRERRVNRQKPGTESLVSFHRVKTREEGGRIHIRSLCAAFFPWSKKRGEAIVSSTDDGIIWWILKDERDIHTESRIYPECQSCFKNPHLYTHVRTYWLGICSFSSFLDWVCFTLRSLICSSWTQEVSEHLKSAG